MWEFIKQVFGFVVSVLVTLYSAWVATMLWGWYIIPWIETAPKLPMIIAIGLMIICRFFTYQLSISDSAYMINMVKDGKNDKEGVQKQLKQLNLCLRFWNFAVITAFLFSGWLFHFFV